MPAKRIALIIAFRDFNDEEYLVPKQIFQSAGFEVFTASSHPGKAVGAYGCEAEVNILLNDLVVNQFQAIVFIGGSGSTKYLDDPSAHRLALEAALQGKVLAAICIAPGILAAAGVLNNKKVTVWSSAMDKSFIRILEKSGAKYLDKSVVSDGKIITASGPDAAQEFAQAIIDRLK